MKKIYLLPLAFFALAAYGQKSNSAANQKEKQIYDINNLDKSVKAGEDFYMFATGGWSKANPIKPEYSRYGSFDALAERNKEQVKGLIEELGTSSHKEGSIGQKIGDLYALGMDSAKLNSDKAKPIRKQLDKINRATTLSEIIQLIGELRSSVSDPYFTFYVMADMKNSSMNLPLLYQGGLGLGDRSYYLEEDAASIELRNGYKELIKKQMVNAGYKTDEAAKNAETILRIETSLAKAHFTKEEKRIPEKNYNKIKFTELEKTVGKFDWNLFFGAINVKNINELNVAQIPAIKEAVTIINSISIDDHKAYLAWCVINSAANYLSDDFVNDNFEFFGMQLSGRKALQPRWRRTVETVEGALSEAVGQMYVERYFPAESKVRMLKLVRNLQSSFSERMDRMEWMDKSTKVKAKDKLNSFTVKIGYPDKWIDYSSLEIKKDSYWENMVRANEFTFNRLLEKIGKPVDKTEWHMPPQMVNAYYSPNTNEICFPAGILQPPFFYKDGDDAVNYGAIGVVIGHEMTHGFDDQGSKFDLYGNLNSWWSDDDSKKFKELSQVIVDRFNAIEVLPAVNANGVFTLGENIADLGGLEISYEAFSKTEESKTGKKIEGFTPQQRFFLSYGQVWAGNIRVEEIIRRTKTDPHSLGKWRVNGTLPFVEAWYKAFNIKPKDSLYLTKENRAHIW